MISGSTDADSAPEFQIQLTGNVNLSEGDYFPVAAEFQLLRFNGRGHDKASYLKALPQHATRSKFSDIVATGNGETLVIRYKIETEQTIDGTPVNGISPRLSVFRKEAGRWLIVAHANFAPIAA